MYSYLKKFSLYVTCALTLGFGTRAGAAVVFDGGSPNQLGSSEEMIQWFQAEDFQVYSPTVLTDVHFWTLEEINAWDGTMDYYLFTDNIGKPAATPFAQGAGVNVGRMATGNTITGLDEYVYQFDLPTPVSLQANMTYWLALHLESDFTNEYEDEIYWEWTDSPGFGYTGHAAYEGDTSNWQDSKAQHAFYLTGFAAPLPGAVWLLGFGLAGLVAARRRKK